MILALSVNDFVDKIGAYAGIAAAFGLALFALLLFSQARELKRLREWGAHAHDRMGEMERRLAAALELARRAGAAQRTGETGPARPAQPVQRPGAPTAARPAGASRAVPLPASTRSPIRLPLLPAAPVGVAGSALGSATTSLPLPRTPAAPAGAPVPAASPAPPSPEPATTVAPVPVVPAPTAPAPETPAAPAPATAAAQGAAPAPPPADPAGSDAPTAPPAETNGHSDTFPPVPPVRRTTPRPPARPGAAAPGTRRPPARPARPTGARPAAAAPLRAHTATATPRGTGTGTGAGDPHRRRLPLVLAGIGLLALLAVGAIVLTGGGGDSTPAVGTTSAGQQGAASPGGSSSAPAPAHDSVTVAVLNGTTVPGLAKTVASELEADGFVRGPVGNAADQQRTVTVVSYFGGNEPAAQEVADTLGVPSDAVQPINAETEASCASTTGACTATVVVTVGADRQ